MGDDTTAAKIRHLVQVAVQVDADLEAYIRTLTHAEALQCVEHIGTSLWQTAALGVGITDQRFRATVPMAGHALRHLARRAARTRPARPGGRAAYNHDDCSAVAALGDVLDRLQQRIDDARSNIAGGGGS